MIAGIKTFSGSVADTVENKLDTDPALRQQWEEVSTRFSYVFCRSRDRLPGDELRCGSSG
uniref:BID domain-containing protein n=1 Tax=Agrobacterium fabrum TaxID=1176649 RepID=UPI0021BD56EE|nr:hypothetical protein [Agrobacterium fabrum]UVZ00130.1 hypothetical protein K4M19_00439 [Agrobacterium fabrum]